MFVIVSSHHSTLLAAPTPLPGEDGPGDLDAPDNQELLGVPSYESKFG